MFSLLRADIIVTSYHWFPHLYLPHAIKHTWPIHCGHRYRMVTFLSHLKLWKLLSNIYSDYFNTRKKSKEASDQLWKEGKIERRVKKCGRKEKMKGWHKRCNRNGLIAEGTKKDIYFLQQTKRVHILKKARPVYWTYSVSDWPWNPAKESTALLTATLLHSDWWCCPLWHTQSYKSFINVGLHDSEIRHQLLQCN